MALTNEQLTELVEKLQTELATITQEVKQYRQDILELEQQLSQSITTQKLVVTGEAQLSGRNILVDGQMLDIHEQRLSIYDTTFSSHDASISAAQATANDTVDRANTAQTTANQALTIARAVDDRTINISTDGKGENTRIDAGNNFLAIQSDGNIVVYGDHGPPLWDTKTFVTT